MGDLFNLILIHPIVNILVAVYQLLLSVGVPYTFGFSIILMTIVIRLLIYPLTASQLRASSKMQKMTPHLSSLKEKHKGDAKALQQATMELYKEHGINPASGCLLALVQLPILLGLYNVFQNLINLKPQEVVSYINNIVYLDVLKIQKPWDMNFFGLPLEQSPEKLLGMFGVAILLIPLLTAVLQFFQSKMLFAKSKDSAAEVAKKAAKKPKEMDFASAMQTQTLYFIPLMLGWVSWKFALGLSLYWNTFTIFGMIQQYLIQREEKSKKPAVSEPKQIATHSKKTAKQRTVKKK